MGKSRTSRCCCDNFFLKTTMAIFLRPFFWMHDGVTKLVRQYYREIKIALLLVAHASLFGLLFPELRNSFGEWARNLLIVLLFASPLSRIFPIAFFQLLMGMRRELGILFAYLVTVHGVGYLIDPLWFPLPLVTYAHAPLLIEPVVLLGIAAYILTLPLLVTSNMISMRLLKGRWKTLHRLVYLVFVLGMLHAFVIRQPSGVWEALLVLGVYAALKMLARYPNIAPIVSFKRAVKEEYGRYVLSKQGK